MEISQEEIPDARASRKNIPTRERGNETFKWNNMAIQKNYEIDTQNWSPIQKELEAAIDQIPFSSGTECIRKGQRDSNGNPYCQ